MDHETADLAMPQAEEEELGLSAATLAALQEFAVDLGIDAGAGGESVRQQVQSHFEDQEGSPEEVFNFGYGPHTLALEGWRRDLGQTLSSTGLTVWAGAEDLTAFLWDHRETLLPPGAVVVELGAGLGLPGLLCGAELSAAAGNGAEGPRSRVILTDGDENSLAKLRANRDRNAPLLEHVDADVAQLRWGNTDDLETLDEMLGGQAEGPRGPSLIIAADVIYQEEAIVPLFATVTRLLDRYDTSASDGDARRCLFVLSFTRRGVSYERVVDEAQRVGLEYRVACECARDMGLSTAPASVLPATSLATAEGIEDQLRLIRGSHPCGCCRTEPMYVMWRP